NFVQEIGHVAQESKSVLFFFRTDIRSLLYTLTGGREKPGEERIDSVSVKQQQQYLAEGTLKILKMLAWKLQMMLYGITYKEIIVFVTNRVATFGRCHTHKSTLTYVNRDDVDNVFIKAKNKEFFAKGLMTLEEYEIIR
ncbi:527_t:CDS:2, partial [Ambispora leptoticha]